MKNNIYKDIFANVIGIALYDLANNDPIEKKLDIIIALLELLLRELSSARSPLRDWRSDNHPGGDT
jgi:hypothetical protein